MSSFRCLAVLATVALVASPESARAAEVVDESLLGRDAPVLPAHAIKSPAAPSDFLVEDHGFLRIVYHPSSFEAVRRIANDADASRAAFASSVGQRVLEHVEVRVARTPEELAMLSPQEAPPSAGSTGVAYPSLSLVVLSVRDRDGAPTTLDEVFRHQLAHVALFDATAGRPLPRWLQEGLAVQMSGEATIARAQILWTAHVRRDLRSIAQLETFPDDARGARIAWAESADFVRFLARDGTRFATTIARTRSGDSIDRALFDAYGADLRSLEQSWRDDLGTRCVTIPLATAGALGWGAAIAAIVVRRRRRRRLAAPPRQEAELPYRIPELPDLPPEERRLLVCDRGLGHVVYIVDAHTVPKVEHDGKRHTVH
jgi:hypothetical protein